MIENNEALLNSIRNENSVPAFVEAFLTAFDFPEATKVKALANLSSSASAAIGKKILFIRSSVENLNSAYSVWLRDSAKEKTRFVFFVSESRFIAQDLETKDSISGTHDRVGKYFDFFLPLLGREATSYSGLSKPDVKAGEAIAALRNELLLSNSEEKTDQIDNAICGIVSLLFANSLLEPNGAVANYVFRHIDNKGSNILDVLDDFAKASHHLLPFNVKSKFRIPDFAGLFVSKDAFFRIKELLDMNWSDIDPEVIGSIVQNIQSESGDFRNFTSKTNVGKLLGPMFLDALAERARNNQDNPLELLKIENEILCNHYFDPCCGTGDFLIYAYKELDAILDKIASALNRPKHSLSPERFLGLSDNSFSCQLAKTIFAYTVYQATKIDDYIDLVFSQTIKFCNPLRVNWKTLFYENNPIVYVFGNVDYSGARKMGPEQKRDMAEVFANLAPIGDLDYSAAWFMKAARELVKTQSSIGFVCTNSIIQGAQVGILWDLILRRYFYKIYIAYKPFKWSNGAKNKTAVTVVAICISRKPPTVRTIYDGIYAKDVKFISPYFTTIDSLVFPTKTILSSQLPLMIKGNMPYDQGNLSKISPIEKQNIIKSFPESLPLFKRIVGSDEYINDIERWCLWIDSEDKLRLAESIPPIAERIRNVYNYRIHCSDAAARKMALRPHEFREMNSTSTYSIVVPSVSSENREYIPMGFVDKNWIITNLSFAIYDAPIWVLGILMSRMHNVWIRTVCGRLEMRLRYSNVLGYNTFPLPQITEKSKQTIATCVRDILTEREEHSEKTLGELYLNMPEGLRCAHHTLDALVDSLYSEDQNLSDNQRLEILFSLYERLHK